MAQQTDISKTGTTQTAVEWLVNELESEAITDYSFAQAHKLITLDVYTFNKLFEQAKQMEKEQRIAAQKCCKREKELKKAISRITNEIKKDINYRESWKANIAMAYKDCEHWYKKETGKKRLNKEDKHIIANNAAEHFLNLLCNK